MKKNNIKNLFMYYILSSIIIAITSQYADAEQRSIYFKVFKKEELIANKNKVNCDSYDDHLIKYFDEPDYNHKITQYDPIIGISTLCESWEPHIDPVVHIDGTQTDSPELTDATDGFIDKISATVYCKDEYGEERPADRVILECIDHDAITQKNK